MQSFLTKDFCLKIINRTILLIEIKAKKIFLIKEKMILYFQELQ